MKAASIAELKKELVRLEHGELLDAVFQTDELLLQFSDRSGFHGGPVKRGVRGFQLYGKSDS